MTTHVWRLPRLGCALQGLLPLLPPTPYVPASCASHLIDPQQLPSDCHLIDDNRRKSADYNVNYLTITINNPLSFDR